MESDSNQVQGAYRDDYSGPIWVNLVNTIKAVTVLLGNCFGDGQISQSGSGACHQSAVYVFFTKGGMRIMVHIYCIH